MQTNVLYYGDNLDILRRYIPDESVDLVYLDPPFNSNATYNVLFAEQNGTRAAAQIKAFEDTWTWDQEAAREYEETAKIGVDATFAKEQWAAFHLVSIDAENSRLAKSVIRSAVTSSNKES